MNALAPRLSKREREVMLGLAEGMTPAEISDVMRISPKTFSEFRRRATVKLDARNGCHALVLWVRGEDRTVERRVELAAVDLVRAVHDIALNRIHRMPKT